jgi:hypothetical protein
LKIFGPKEEEEIADHLEDLGVNERIILKEMFKEMSRRVWRGLICRRIGKLGDWREALFNTISKMDVSVSTENFLTS